MSSWRHWRGQIKDDLSAARALAFGDLLVLITWWIRLTTPPERWYPIALALARFSNRAARRLKPTFFDPSLVPRMLHRLLDLIAGDKRHFPIPIEVEGEELLHEYAALPGGFICCTAHIPFIKLFIPLARRVAAGREIKVAVRWPLEGGNIDVWNDAPLPAIKTDNSILLHTRSLLRRNGCLLLVVDREQGEVISSNIFRFVHKMRSRILMTFPTLREDGTIVIRIVRAPGPECLNEEEIRANLDFVAANVRAIFTGTALPRAGARPRIVTWDPGDIAARNRELDRIQLYSLEQLESRVRRLEHLLAREHPSPHRAALEQRLHLMRSEMIVRAGARIG